MKLRLRKSALVRSADLYAVFPFKTAFPLKTVAGVIAPCGETGVKEFLSNLMLKVLRSSASQVFSTGWGDGRQ